MHGKIFLPSFFLRDPRGVFVRLSLAPAAIEFDANPFNLHPNLMHINMKTNKRARKLAVSIT